MAADECSLWDLQARLIYVVLVAGKSAKFAETKLAALLRDRTNELPFDVVLDHVICGDVEDWLRAERTGSYGRLAKCLPALIYLDPRTCTIQQLEAVHGIGPKTARFFVMWTRPGVMCATLDTHVLKWLRSLGYDAPKSTPQAGPLYEALEGAFLSEAKKRGQTPRELDLEVWEWYAKGRGQLQLPLEAIQ